MQRKLKMVVMALCCPMFALAQTPEAEGQKATQIDESAFTFTEAQLGEDDDMSQNVTILNSNTNIYASQVGYLFSPVRFRYRAFNQRYNDVYINGAPMNDMESGQFRYSLVGGINQLTRNVDFALPFEDNSFSMPGMGGSNNYDFRASHVSKSQRVAVSGANRNYTARAMYTFGTGLNSRGWALAGSVAYRWADRGYVEGTFYNSLSYFLGVQKVWNEHHSLSLSTWGNPTERASQGAATDESYWLANDRYYNPYWGYQNGKKRNSRVVNDFSPSAVATWDWTINDDMKLVTSLAGRYGTYKSTKLNYNNADNPQPDYWKNLPSSYYDVWNDNAQYRTEQALSDWQTAYDYLTSEKSHRQINWDRLYWANRQAALQGGDAMYFVQAKHNDNVNASLSSVLNTQLKHNLKWTAGFLLAQNKGMHYQTMEDMLGAQSYHNINTYALGNYSMAQDAVQYDLNTAGPNRMGRLIYEGDRFGYDYDINVHKATVWSSLAYVTGRYHMMVAGRFGGTEMYRNGHMRNGMFADNSYGKSGTAHFGDGGLKGSINADLGGGHVVKLGVGCQWNAPMASTAFVSPEMNNDFVTNLKNERVLSSELCYQYQNAWLHANVNAYYSQMDDVTEWQNFYFDDINSFSYVSMTGIKKQYYGVELGLDFKINSQFNVKAIGTMSEARNANNAHVRFMNSTKATFTDDVVMNKDMREAGTPLTAGSLILSYHKRGWYLNLNANYYDRIYLSYSPSYRYQSTLETTSRVNNDGTYDVPSQAKGHGGFMLDGSIGKSVYLHHGNMLSINLSLTNLLNNQSIVTGGYEQSRSDYTVKADGSMNNERAYKFSQNPKKYYAYGLNGMLNITYRF